MVVWRHILPRLEDMVNMGKRDRLNRERQEALDARALVIQNAYYEYKATLSPRSWAFLPAFRYILLSEPFWSLYNDPSNDSLDPTTCVDVISQLPTIISTWRDELRDKLASSVPVQPIFPDRPFRIYSEYRPPILSNLDLATSVFTCHGCCEDGDKSGFCLIGWDDVKNHLGCPRMLRFGNNGVTASCIGHYAALEVMRLLDLDGQTVTAKEVDECDARFLCANCPIAGFRHVRGHKAFTWRECVRFRGHYLPVLGFHLTFSYYSGGARHREQGGGPLR
jgi:hypothetical protein